jgi:hypothetical protein
MKHPISWVVTSRPRWLKAQFTFTHPHVEISRRVHETSLSCPMFHVTTLSWHKKESLEPTRDWATTYLGPAYQYSSTVTSQSPTHISIARLTLFRFLSYQLWSILRNPHSRSASLHEYFVCTSSLQILLHAIPRLCNSQPHTREDDNFGFSAISSSPFVCWNGGYQRRYLRR